jgi:hypothetical protein
MFLKAAAIVVKQSPSTVFVLAGDGPEQERLEDLADELGVAANVHFLGRVENVPELLAALDVSVLSSVHEAFPLSLLESMSASLPMVATDVGSVCEIVEDGVNGFLVPSGDHEKFAAAILRLVTDPELARRLGASGRKKLENQFTLGRMVGRCESLFTEWSREARCTRSRQANEHSTDRVPSPCPLATRHCRSVAPRRLFDAALPRSSAPRRGLATEYSFQLIMFRGRRTKSTVAPSPRTRERSFKIR